MQIKNQKGYMLIELIVAMTLFVAVFSIVAASFVTALRTQRDIVSFVAANDNVSAAMEQMSREIRTGVNFIIRPNGILDFTNARGERIRYRLHAGRIERAVGDGEGNVFASITASNVRIARLNFLQSANLPPRFTISVRAKLIGRGLEDISLDLQTTISPRILF